MHEPILAPHPSELLSRLAEELGRARAAEESQRFAELQRIGHRLRVTLSMRGLEVMAHQAHKLEMAACYQESLMLQRALRKLTKSYDRLIER